MSEVRKTMDDVKEQVSTKYEKTEREIKHEDQKQPTEEKAEAEGRGKV